MSRILVTGGTGYIGGRMISSLRKFGHDVCCGTRSKLRSSNDFINTDFDNIDLLISCFNNFDTIVHLGGVNEIDAVVDPDQAIHTTVTYTQRAVKAAVEANVKKFIYFSTVHVYGSPLKGLINEDSPTYACHPYSITHRAAEDFVFSANKYNKIDAIIFRLSNGYGYPEDVNINRWTLLVNDLCKQAVLHGKMELKSSGIQTRDFIPISDIGKAVNHSLTLSHYDNPIFNLGSGVSISVRSMAEMVAERYELLTGKAVALIIPETKEGEEDIFFQLSVDKFNDTGFKARSIKVEEIDELLRKCLSWNEGGLFRDE